MRHYTGSRFICPALLLLSFFCQGFVGDMRPFIVTSAVSENILFIPSSIGGYSASRSSGPQTSAPCLPTLGGLFLVQSVLRNADRCLGLTSRWFIVIYEFDYKLIITKPVGIQEALGMAVNCMIRMVIFTVLRLGARGTRLCGCKTGRIKAYDCVLFMFSSMPTK
jgi:hypothetical protein